MNQLLGKKYLLSHLKELVELGGFEPPTFRIMANAHAKRATAPQTFKSKFNPKGLAFPQGFEPRYPAPGADVLPLNEGNALKVGKINMFVLTNTLIFPTSSFSNFF